MKKKEKKENTAILFLVLKEIIKKMRTADKLFDSLKPKLDFLGSYFDGLRVGHASEYDINVILKFPINYENIKLSTCNSFHDYTNIIMPSEFRRLAKIPETSNKGFMKTKLWCNKEYKLSVSKFRSWMQSVVDHALNTMPLENGIRVLVLQHKHKYRIFKKISGPAITLTVIKEDNSAIDVDLVPTFTFKLPKKPVDSKVCFTKVESTNIHTYFVVPKPNGDDFSWRLTFPFQERYYLKNNNNLKSVIRLIKHFRDIQGFTKLCSYFIKTLFLWQCVTMDNSYWTRNSMYYLVINMLHKLKDSLGNRDLRNFWCPDHNILEKIKPETCKNWHNRLNYILNDIECKQYSKPNVILNYFSKH
ncbi:unnamed protein product, partial [Brenthis ino]